MKKTICSVCGSINLFTDGESRGICNFCGCEISAASESDVKIPTVNISYKKVPPIAYDSKTLPAAYSGKLPYIFVSYAHKNSEQAIEIIKALSSEGFRVWYDAGIEAGTEWPDYIAERLKNAECVLALLSE